MGSKETIGKPFQAGNKAAVGHGHKRMTHGLTPRRFAVGSLPRGCSWIIQLVAKLRREIEALTLEVHGVVGPREALLIQSACRHEQAALLSQRWLRKEAESMTHGERLQYLQAIAAESDKRDKCLERLKLDTDPKSLLESLYSTPEKPTEAENAS